MKTIFNLLLFLILSTYVQAQGSVTNITMSPTNPTSTDTIYIYTHLQFTSGDCPLDQQSHMVNDTTIQATSHHCTGLLTVICNTIDTFKINPLPPGNYNFDFSLTSGAGAMPCTPGIVPDDSTEFSFTVDTSETAHVNTIAFSNFHYYPNPIDDQVNLPTVPNGTKFSIIDLTGQTIQTGFVEHQTITGLATLSTGLYFLKLNFESIEITKRIVKR